MTKVKFIFAGILILLLLCLCSCDTSHVHEYNRETVDEKYLARVADCTAPAIYYNSCECGEKGAETFVYGEATGHNTNGTVEHKDATCTEAGVVGGTYCTVCFNGKEAAETVIKATGHNTDGTVEHKDASCTEAGVVGGTYCTVCFDGKEAAETVIKATGHNTDGTVKHKDASCTEPGVVGGTYCTVCFDGKEAAETVIKATGHNTNGTVEHKDATCTEPGVVGGTYCTVCFEGKEAAETITQPNGHNSYGIVEHKDASCTEAGVVGGTYCTACLDGKEAAEAILPAGHNTNGVIEHKDASCTEAGVVGGTYCTVCFDGKEAAETVIKATGHNTNGTVEHKDATCTESGVVGGTYCTACDEGKAEAMTEISPNGHNANGIVEHKDAVCLTPGVVGGTYCTVCFEGKEAAEAIIQPVGGHSFDYLDYKAATCTESGIVGGFYCTVCLKDKEAAEEIIEPLGHNNDGIVEHKDATCIGSGVVGGTYCARCNAGKEDAEKLIEPNGHNNDGTVEHKDATCTESGIVGGTYCTVCSEGKYVAELILEPLGHNSYGVVKHKDATCTESGVVGGTYCARCNAGKEDAEMTIQPNGHNANGLVEHKDASCTESGIVGGTYCTVCFDGKVAAETVIQPNGHNSYGVVKHKDATCTESGVVGGTYCTVCFDGKEAAETITQPNGHNSYGVVKHKDASCTESGVVGGTYCTVCFDGKEAAETVIQPNGHIYDKQVTEEKYAITVANCLNSGEYYYSCKCGEKGSETFTFGPTEHNFDETTADIVMEYSTVNTFNYYDYTGDDFENLEFYSCDESVLEVIASTVYGDAYKYLNIVTKTHDVGKATVFIKSKDGEIIDQLSVFVKKEDTVHVGDGELCESITLDKTEAEVYKDDTTVTYTITTSSDVDKIELIQISIYGNAISFSEVISFSQAGMTEEINRLDIDGSKLTEAMILDSASGTYYAASKSITGDKAVWTIKWNIGDTSVRFVQVKTTDSETSSCQESFVRLNIDYPLIDASLGLKHVIERWVELNLDKPFIYEIDTRTMTDEQLEIYLSRGNCSIYDNEEFILLGMPTPKDMLDSDKYMVDDVDIKTLYDKIFDASPIFRGNFVTMMQGYGMVGSYVYSSGASDYIETVSGYKDQILVNYFYESRTYLYYYTIREETRAIIAYENGFEIDAEKFPYAHSILEKAQLVLDEIITEGMTDFEKERAIFTWMFNYHYENEDSYKDLPDDEDMYQICVKTAYGFLNGYGGDCMGWSSTFFTLCNMAGIACSTVDVEASPEQGGAVGGVSANHRINLVRLDGEYYFVDSHWSYQVSQGEYYTFNMTSEVASNSYAWNTENGFGPVECNYETYLVDPQTGELLNK